MNHFFVNLKNSLANYAMCGSENNYKYESERCQLLKVSI